MLELVQHQKQARLRGSSERRTTGAPKRRDAFGVRGACSRFRSPRAFDSGSKLRALQTLRAVLRHLRFVQTVFICFRPPYSRTFPQSVSTRDISPPLAPRLDPPQPLPTPDAAPLLLLPVHPGGP